MRSGVNAAAGQIVFEIHQPDQLPLIHDWLTQDRPRLPLLHVRIRHEPLVQLCVIDDDGLFRSCGEMNDAEWDEAGALGRVDRDRHENRDLVCHDAALGLYEELAVACQQEHTALGAGVLDEYSEQPFEQAPEHDFAGYRLPSLDQSIEVEARGLGTPRRR